MAESTSHDTNLKKKIAGNYLPASFSFVILVLLDQFTKNYIISHMELYASIPIIKEVFEIKYIQNVGAAWGVLKNQQTLFILCTGIVFFIGIGFYVRCVKKNCFKDIRFYTILILAGAAGNLIDRIRLHYVIDFLYFKLINFPIFNIADCYVTIGFFLLLITVLFKYKDDDFEQLKTKK